MAPAPSSPSFADVLRRLRERAGLTQEELAERAALTAHAVSALERGAAQGLQEAAGATVYGYYRPDDALKEAAAVQARLVLGDDAWDDAVDEGRALEVDDAVRYVLTGSARPLRLAT